MRINSFLSPLAFGLLCSTAYLTTGCADYSAEIEQLQEEKDQTHIVLRLSLGDDGCRSRGMAVKAPTGGEDGDGHRLGVYHENDINDLCIFRFLPDAAAKAKALAAGTLKKRGVALINSLPSTSVEKVAYLPQVNYHPGLPGASYTGDLLHYEIPLKIKTKGDGTVFKPAPVEDCEYYVVIANMGDVNATTPGELRNPPVQFAWKKGAASDAFADYHSFVMTNEGSSQWDGTGQGTEVDPYIFTMDIERVAARLEFCYTTDKGTPNIMPSESLVDAEKPVIIYEAADTPKGGSSTPVGTVYLTHVRPFNVMKSPTSLLKMLAPANDDGITYKASSAEYLADELAFKSAYTLGRDPLYVVDPLFNSKKNPTDDQLKSWYGDSRWSNAAEGWWFSDDYRVPDPFAGGNGFSTGYSDDVVDPNNHYYVLDYSNENTMGAKAANAKNVTGYLLKTVYVPNKVYATAADALADHPVASFKPGTTFYRYVPAVVNYDETQSRCFTTKSAADDYAASLVGGGEVQIYEHGICYYPVYLRHDNYEDYPSADPTPMEFGIVRNNIYRLRVSFSGPGYVSPTEKGEPLGIKPYIYTRPWYKVVHEEITI